MKIRTAEPEDMAALRAVADAALTFDSGAALVDRLAAPPAGRRWAVLAADDLSGLVMTSISDRDPSIGHIDLLAVRPDVQGSGRGRALVETAQDWLRGEGATVAKFAGNPPCYAWPGVDVRHTPAACLAERLGYTLERTAWNMTADLATADLSTAGDVARLAAAGVTVAAAPAGERDRVADFVREQWNETWAWESVNAAGLHYAVRDDGQILGFAAWGSRPAWFGPMGTAPAARGLGAGRVLLRRCLSEMRDAGLGAAEIGWVGPLRFYSRTVGARTERVFWLYRRELG
ncbi:GNAT family N-acetyltransferase [Sinosporangium siamense]|uniref:N-acetyltransferase domain-containing protein n=1 Tax=Sinosporangium siamense TaxID=1367973 RepID=A0A919RDC5_9ACTN|nr:GNAT family N-acetyltransferase [Sinosporangium siamense]GII91553.1 hypothetical protein Ssi02_17840 [Sinosporangium siamense]